MPDQAPRWNLKHLLIGIAILAVSFALIGVAGTVIGLAVCSPVAIARPGRRLVGLYWITTCYPLFVLLSFHVTWIAGWVALGHAPRSSMDDPKDIDPIAVPYLLSAILLGGTPLIFLASIGAMLVVVIHPSRDPLPAARRSAPLLIVPMTWLACYGILKWDPLSVVEWYFD